MQLRVLTFLVVVLLAYAPAVTGGFLWDDENEYLVKNTLLHDREGLGRIWLEPGATPQYYPMVFTCFWVEYRLWGLQPAGYHVVNIVLHGINAALVWRLLQRLEVPGAWVVGLLFALHPVHVESVAWISERKNVLSGFFYLLSFLAFIRFSPWEQKTPVKATGWRWYALALALYAAALLSKTVTCSLPAVVVLVYWWKRSWPTAREWLALVPMFLLGLRLALITSHIEHTFTGASGPDWDFSPVDRCLIAGRALWFYAGKLAWPHPLMFNYPRWVIDASEAWQYLYPAAVLAVLAILALPRVRRVIGRGPLTACLIFAGTLTPALGFFNVYPHRFSFVADHFQYLASIALLTLATSLAAHWLGPRCRRRTLEVGTVALLLALGLLTWRQCHAYKDIDTLWHDTISKNPTSFLANYNLGTRALGKENVATAVECFERAAATQPRFPGLYINWGIALGKQGDYQGAFDKIQHALKFNKEDPVIYYNLGLALMYQKRFAEALPYLDQALEREPNHTGALHARGDVLMHLGAKKPPGRED